MFGWRRAKSVFYLKKTNYVVINTYLYFNHIISSYFDKSLQFIVFENGKAGFNGEVGLNLFIFIFIFLVN